MIDVVLEPPVIQMEATGNGGGRLQRRRIHSVRLAELGVLTGASGEPCPRPQPAGGGLFGTKSLQTGSPVTAQPLADHRVIQPRLTRNALAAKAGLIEPHHLFPFGNRMTGIGTLAAWTQYTLLHSLVGCLQSPRIGI